MESITIEARTYDVKIEPDYDQGLPWEECDAYGVVSEWTTRGKKPEEIVLAQDRGLCRYYDKAATLEKARRDSWGLAPEEAKGLTPGQITERAVMKDFEYLKAFCDDRWIYHGVIVIAPDGAQESLWGVEIGDGIDNDYRRGIAQELADALHADWIEKVAASDHLTHL